GRDFPIERGGNFQADERAFPFDSGKESAVQFHGSVFFDVFDDFDTGALKLGNTVSIDAWIAVAASDDAAADTGGNNGIGAGWRLSEMRARLQRYIQGCAARFFSGLFDSLRFCMRPATITGRC